MIRASEEQIRKRKLIGSSFYKDKLLKMAQIINQCVAEKNQYLEERYFAKNDAFDLIGELDELHTKIILTSAFGIQGVSNL